MKEEYRSLYAYMEKSKSTEDMKLFGRVMNEMMDYLIESDPDKAREFIGKLSSVKWDNYLTRKEAEDITSAMKPEAPWDYESWKESMDGIGIRLCEEPHYNEYSLFAVMNMVYSDSLNSIVGISRKTLADFTEEELISDVHMLAIDKLMDEDGVFDVRRYFGLKY